MNTTAFAKKIFGLSNIKGIEPINFEYRWRYKIVVFTPVQKADEITFLMASAGAGVVGAYTLCSFRTKGTGTFVGGKSTIPYAGKKERFEMVDEVRLEMICDEERLDAAINAMYEVHPYEEPAYEVYPVMIRSKKPDRAVIAVSFKKSLDLKSVLSKINNSLDSANLKKLPLQSKIISAVIDFTGRENFYPEVKGRKKVLYISKSSDSDYEVRLV